MTSYRSKVSSNGQVSIPAEVRRRWMTTQVVVVDRGDRIVVRPVPDDPLDAVIGKYADLLPSSEDLRAAARAEDAERE